MSSSSNVVCIYTAAWTSFGNWGLNGPISIETKRVFNGPNFVEDEKGLGLCFAMTNKTEEFGGRKITEKSQI